MISVAVALYNSLRYIEEQLDSIKNQTIQVDEVVLIDDCSTDNTIDFVKRYINKYSLHGWKLFFHSKNKGYINTFTEAIGKTSGDIIILCDHDDIWLPNKVELIKLQFESNAEILSLATRFIQINADGLIVRTKNKPNHANNNLIRRKVKKRTLNKMTLKDVAVYNISPGCTCAISCSLRNKLMDIDTRYLPHDWKLNILAACQDGLYYLDIPTTKYRIYDNNTIGLGHVNEFNQRKKSVKNNCKEKIEASSIIANELGNENSDFRYYKNVENVFKLRWLFMRTNQKKYLIGALIKSLGINKLYESIIMDYLSSVRRARVE